MGARAGRRRRMQPGPLTLTLAWWLGWGCEAADVAGQAWSLGAGASCVESHSAPARRRAGLVSNSV
eukprot:scaffold12481_cov78-Isochrysis_galbana.AAC.1